jgi:hypothetical protein
MRLSVYRFLALLSFGLFLVAGCAARPSDESAKRQPLDYAGLTGDGHFNMASDLRYRIEVTAEMLIEEGNGFIDSPWSITVFSSPTDDTALVFEGYMHSFEHPPVLTFDQSSGFADNPVIPAEIDKESIEIVEGIYKNVIEGVPGGKWIDDPLFIGKERVTLDDVAPLFELGLTLKTPDETVRKQRAEQYPISAGRLKVGVYYVWRHDPVLHVEPPVVFIFSGRTTSKVFALAEPFANNVHQLTEELLNRRSQLRKGD